MEHSLAEAQAREEKRQAAIKQQYRLANQVQDAYEQTDDLYKVTYKHVSYGEIPVSTKAPCTVPMVAPIPSHYDAGGIETIDFIKAKLTPEQYKGYLLGNIIKYSSRLNFKGDSKKDAAKLHDYTSWLGQHIIGV